MDSTKKGFRRRCVRCRHKYYKELASTPTCRITREDIKNENTDKCKDFEVSPFYKNVIYTADGTPIYNYKNKKDK